MNKSLFMGIVDRLSIEVPFFQQRRDAIGRFGHYALQKSTAAIRMMENGCAADAVDEYLRLGESTAISCLEHFVEGIINLFGDEYLRRPTPEDLQRILDIGEIRGFPGMRAYIILHNMIVEDERDGYAQVDVLEFLQVESNKTSQVDFTYSTDMPSNLGNMMNI